MSAERNNSDALVFFLVNFIPSSDSTITGRSARICALKEKVEVSKVHIFVQSGI
jgi:hypothetical protein